MNWQEAFYNYLLHDYIKRGGGELSENSLKANLQDVRHFARFAGAAFHPRGMSPEFVKSYFGWQTEQKVAARSYNRRLASLKNLVKFCLVEGWLDHDPTIRIRRKEYEAPIPRNIRDFERGKLEQVARAGTHLRCQTERYQLYGLRDKVIFGLMNDAGLRVHEVAGLCMHDLADMESRHRIHVCGKGKREGYVHISQFLINDILAWLDWRPCQNEEPNAPVITNLNGERITTGQVRRRFYQITNKANVDASPHDMRHTFLYRTVAEGKKRGLPEPIIIDMTRRQGRHGDIRSTYGYLRVDETQIESIVEGMYALPTTTDEMNTRLVLEQGPRVTVGVEA